jgi:Fe-S cluster biogenesis protein NfuA
MAVNNIKKMTTEEITNNVLKALEEIRPFLNSDGGDIKLVSIEDGKHVTVRLEGACTSCSVSHMTLRAGVETTIKKYVPQIETVVNIA